MTRTTSRLLSALLLCCGAGAAQADVVVSQAYGGGGNSGAPYNADFVELFNTGDLPVSLGGKSVQYASATGTGNFGSSATQIVVLPDVEIPAGGYFLVGLAGGATGGPLPTPDATGTINMSGTAGKIVLANTTTSLGCNGGSTACTSAQLALILDLVGFGSANFFEGSAPAPAPSNSTSILRAGDGCTDTNNNAADFATGAPAPRNAASIPNICSGGGTLYLSITDTSGAEGDSGRTPFFVTVSLNQPAGPEGVSFTYTTADGMATVADNDYIARSGTISFEEGQRELSLSVEVVGDETVEPDEVFYINLSDVSGAEVAKGQATVTILNDDVTTLPIHEIQGRGARSPVEGQPVATSGIVTGRKNNGFFIQTPDGEDDGDPATSEGLFVFTNSAPSADVAVGNKVLVQGTVTEYVPTADPLQLPLTQITNASVVKLSEGHALPAAIVLTNDMPNATGGLEQLEHLEGMRVTAPSFTVVAPTTGNTNEAQATGSSNGRFAVVVTGTARPFREPGIQIPDPDPLGSVAPNIPRWDYNPELIAVNSTTIGAPTADLAAGCRITGGSLTGPLDYTFRRYTIYPEGALTSDCTGAGEPRPSMLPGPDHVTFATYNLQRFFDTVNDANSGPTLTPAALERRLSKASIGIRAYLHTPDVVGVTEVENLPVLTTLANRINADAIAAGQPDPAYVAYLEEGFDVGGIDVGFLVKTASVGSVARIAVNTVVQEGGEEVLVNPNGSTSVLNDRPPLVLDAVAHFTDGRSYPFTAIVVHQRSLSGIEADTAGTNGWATGGQRVRDKRQKQAEYLARLIDGMQKDDATRQIVVLGDFNAFEFNDGYVDAMGTVTGLPSPDGETAVDNDGAVLIAPSLLNMTLEASAEERYSFVFDYQAQSLDHVLVNQALVDSPLVVGLDVSHARINADFSEVARNDANTPTRLSDHDPTVLLVRLQPATVADLGITVAAANAEVFAGDTLAFTATLTNAGPDAAQFPGFGAVLDAELDDLLVTPPADWSCDAPAVADGKTTLSCSSETLANAAQAVFALSAVAPDALIDETVTLTVAATSQTQDPNAANDSAVAAVSIVEDPATAAQPLVNGVQLGGIEGATGESRLFRIDVPAGARNLRILTAGGTGDVTLYASRDVLPTVDAWQLRSQRPGNNETVTLAAPQAGTWYVRVLGERAFGRLTVRASYTP
ncbi:pre-peptidase C-terminal domain-containing protein [Luteimonas fraxinea]|uniref:Pre-peptidase C-terminal domain-containing protein n=1 Tax=Luteimonas fraxinea TaxID=2901869 RepID=A0ABS8UI99_9GAMM|nr:pre-peptidase C-terminal domain-containing protein [Luteimonas fraxinea]MCD9098645.1 pre-peptidase C-terminal domain-containing protein [Luteimonas fraxinea]